MEIELTVNQGPDAGKTVRLNRFPVVIGRQADCDVALSDTSVSRRHVQIGMVGSDLFVEDIGSSYGMLIDGETVDQAKLNDGTSIVIGNTEILVHLCRDGAAAEETTTSYGGSGGSDIPPIETSDIEVVAHLPDGTMQTALLDRPESVFGRFEDCDVPINDPQMSKRHFRIRRLPHQFVLEDLESRNGTFVDDEKRNYCELLPGSRILAGQTRFVVRFVPKVTSAGSTHEMTGLQTTNETPEGGEYRATMRQARIVWYESVGEQPPIGTLLSNLSKLRPLSLLIDPQAVGQLKCALPSTAVPLCDWFEPEIAKRVSPMFLPAESATECIQIVGELEESDGWIAYLSDTSSKELLEALRQLARGGDSSPDGLDDPSPGVPAFAKPSLFADFVAHGNAVFCERVLAAAKAVVMESKEPGGWQALGGPGFRKPLEHAGYRPHGGTQEKVQRVDL